MTTSSISDFTEIDNHDPSTLIDLIMMVFPLFHSTLLHTLYNSQNAEGVRYNGQPVTWTLQIVNNKLKHYALEIIHEALAITSYLCHFQQQQ